jgi:hypothetical protein
MEAASTPLRRDLCGQTRRNHACWSLWLDPTRHINDGIQPAWGKDRLPRLDQRRLPRAGLAHVPQGLRPGQEIPDDRRGPRRPGLGGSWALGRRGRRVQATVEFSAWATSSSCPIRAAASARARPSPRPTVKDFGYGDLRDILAGVDTVLAKYPVDPNRIGITGWSYGGFMTMFAVTQTHRFRPRSPAPASPTG